MSTNLLITKQDVLNDIKRVSRLVNGQVTRQVYRLNGKFASSTVEQRFGSFTKAVRSAGVRSNVR